MVKKLRFKNFDACLMILMFLITIITNGQTTVFSENMGTPSGTTNITANTFQNSGTLVYSGTGDVRSTGPSNYANASAAGNVFITNTIGTFFTISNINTQYYTGLSLSFGHYKSAGTTTGLNDLAVEYSTDGTTYNPITYNRTTTGATWTLITATGAIPSSATLSIRFRQTVTTSQYRIDDVVLTGTINTPVLTTTVATAITTVDAASGGNITAAGASAVTARGVVWSTATAPTIALTTITNDGAGTGAFTSSITGLAANTRYHYRAYATNTQGTSYGTENNFYTLAATPAAPAVNGATVSSLNVAIADANNNSTTTYAIRVNGSDFVQANGSLGATAVWQTASQWATKTVTGLTAGTAYTFDIKARNGAATPIETAYSTTTQASTLPATSPHLTPGAASLAFGSVCTNATASGYFSFSGEYLIDPATLEIAALSGYSYSLTEAGTYTTSLTITNYTGASTTVYVKFAPSAVQSYNGAIAVSGQGSNASAQFSTTVSGAGINTAATVATVNGATSISQSGGTISGTTVMGCTAISAYNFEYSTVSIAPGSGTTIAASITGATFSVSLTGLQPGTTYYYRAKLTDGTGTYYGNQYSFSTSAIPAPVAGAATNITQDTFTANWSAVSTAAYYLLDVSSSPTFGTNNPAVTATDLFISEYVEGTSNNKYIEIYNGTGASVSLSDYRLRTYANGTTNPTDALLSGTLANGATIVYRNSSANIYGGTTSTTSAGNYNGNDAVVLYKISTASNVDIIGRIGEDPGTAWTAAGGYTTLDRTLRRKNTVTGGVTVNPTAGFPTLTTEWDVFEIDNVSNLGSHDFGYVPSFVSGYQNLMVTGTSQEVTGLTPYTAYYYRVRAYSASSLSANSNMISLTTLPGTIAWVVPNGATTPQWVPAVTPDITTDVIIAADYNTAAYGAFSAKSLTLNSGYAFTIAPNTTVTVQNAVTNNATPQSFTVADNGALLQYATSANTTGVTVLKNSNELYRLDYTMWSSPVTGQNLSDFSSATSTNRFYEYKYAQNSSNNWVEGYWSVNPATTSFEAGKGYLIRMPNSITTLAGYSTGDTATSYNGSFAGIPNTGTITQNLSTAANRFTAVGNPYPSPISVYEFFDQNSSVLDQSGAIYLWRKKNDTGSSSYATLSLAGYIANQGNTEGGQDQAGYFSNTDETTWTIAPGQGFIIQTLDTAPANPVISFNNSMRKPAPLSGGQAFFKQAQQTAKSRLWVNLTTTDGGFSQMAVAYMQNATTGIDFGYDGKKLSDTNSISLYTVASQQALAIQARPQFETEDVVTVGYTATTAGTHTLSLDHVDGLFAAGQNIYLKDNTEGIVRNLSENNYTFTTEAGTFEDRFEIVYTTTALGTDNPVIEANAVVVYQDRTGINITTGTALIESVNIYDIRGRKLLSAANINASQTVISSLAAAHEMLIIEVSTNKGTVTKKIVY